MTRAESWADLTVIWRNVSNYLVLVITSCITVHYTTLLHTRLSLLGGQAAMGGYSSITDHLISSQGGQGHKHPHNHRMDLTMEEGSSKYNDHSVHSSRDGTMLS